MNERIKELARKAGISILYEYDGYDGHAAVANLADIEKFAELILSECIDICEQTRYEGRVAANRIKFVFGIDNQQDAAFEKLKQTLADPEMMDVLHRLKDK